MMPPNPSAVQLVGAWVNDHDPRSPLLASWAAHDLERQLSVREVVSALAYLTREGVLRQVFAVRVPSGPWLARTYDSLDAIEEEVRDQLNRPVRRGDLEVAPAFQRVVG